MESDKTIVLRAFNKQFFELEMEDNKKHEGKKIRMRDIIAGSSLKYMS